MSAAKEESPPSIVGAGRNAFKISRSALWSAADFWVQQTSQLLTFLLIGNFLGPAVVGVMTMALITVLLLGTLLENGFADALIQRVDLRAEHFNSAFWLTLSLGVVLALVLWLATPFVARAFSEPQLNDILPVMGIALPCIAASDCYAAMLRRELKFRALAIRSILAYGIGFIAAISSAALGYGIYSLVAFFLVSRGLQPALLLIVTRTWPGLQVSRSALAEIVDFGKHRVGNQVIGYVVGSVDRFVVGIFLGPMALGLYAIASRMVSALTNGIAGVLMRVAFPMLASQQSERERFNITMERFLMIANLIALPAFAGLAVTSVNIVIVLFSPIWIPAAPLMAILSLAALVMPTNYILAAATNALGRPDVAFKLSSVMLVLRIAACLIAVQFGVTAVAIANVVVSMLALPIFLFAINDLFKGRWLRLFRRVWVPAVASSFMAVVVLLIQPLLQNSDRVVALACQVLVGVAAYAIAVWFMAAPLEARSLAQMAFKRSPTRSI